MKPDESRVFLFDRRANSTNYRIAEHREIYFRYAYLNQTVNVYRCIQMNKVFP